MVLYLYTAQRRDVLGCTSMTTKKFPWFALGTSQGLRVEVRGDVQPNISRLEAVFGHSLINLNPFLGMYFLIDSESVKINSHDERMHDIGWY